MSKEKKKFNFTKAFTDLEAIAASFEDGGVDLEEGIKKFEQGLFLARELKTRLSKLENKIEEIKIKYTDALKE